MIDYDRGRIIQGGKEEVIAKFEVWFMVPNGLCRDYHEAKEAIAALGEDIPMNMTVTPLPVAVGEHGNYEILLSNRS